MSVAKKYIDAVNRADIDALMGLFAPTASLKHPAGTFTDPAALRQFYETVVFTGQAVTDIEAQFRDGDTEIVQIRASSPLGEPGHFVYAADIFTVRDGLIERLEIYYR